MNRLLICSPLRLEARAVRRGIGDDGDVRQTGYGPRKSAAQAAKLRPGPFGMLAIAGTGGGLSADLSPGDLVVGAQVSGTGPVISCPSAPLLAGELRRAGLRARAGQIVTVDHLVHGPGRARLAAAGSWSPTWSPRSCLRRRLTGPPSWSGPSRTPRSGRC